MARGRVTSASTAASAWENPANALRVRRLQNASTATMVAA